MMSFSSSSRLIQVRKELKRRTDTLIGLTNRLLALTEDLLDLKDELLSIVEEDA